MTRLLMIQRMSTEMFGTSEALATPGVLTSMCLHYQKNFIAKNEGFSESSLGEE